MTTRGWFISCRRILQHVLFMINKANFFKIRKAALFFFAKQPSWIFHHQIFGKEFTKANPSDTLYRTKLSVTLRPTSFTEKHNVAIDSKRSAAIIIVLRGNGLFLVMAFLGSFFPVRRKPAQALCLPCIFWSGIFSTGTDYTTSRLE